MDPIGPQPIQVPASPFLASSGPIISRRVTALAVNPQNSDIVYLGAASGGVWKSTDGGATWTPLTDFQPTLSTGSLAIDPSSCTPDDCTTIYAGTGEVYGSDIDFGAGILNSTDAGATWTQQGASIFAPQGPTDRAARIGAVAVDPFNSQIVLAGTSGGLYRTTDGGATWTLVAALSGQGTGLALDGNNSGVVYAAISQSTAAGSYRSTDHGVTWTRLGGTGGNLFPATDVGYIAVSIVSAASGTAGSATLYAAVVQAGSSSLHGVWKSSDSGANWVQLTGRNFTCNAGASSTVIYFGLTRHTQESCGPGPGGDMQMTVTIGSSEIANAGTVTMTAVNPPPGGGTSLRTNFVVTAASANRR